MTAATADVPTIPVGETIRLMLVDDEALIRQGLRSALEHTSGIDVVGEAGNAWEAQSGVVELQPDLVLMEVRMPLCDGIRATVMLRERNFPGQVVFLTNSTSSEHLFNALRVGAAGYLLKTAQISQIVDAVRAVAAGGVVLAPEMAKRLLDDFEFSPVATVCHAFLSFEALTKRELEVLDAIAVGLSNDEIANQLVVTLATVKAHVSHILRKLGVRDRLQAAITAREGGLTGPR